MSFKAYVALSIVGSYEPIADLGLVGSKVDHLGHSNTYSPSWKLQFEYIDPMPPASTGVTITNPLVLYRSLVATQKIRPDPAQHRLALHLQKVYERLIDYEPSVEYGKRLKQLSRTVDAGYNAVPPPPSDLSARSVRTQGMWASLLAHKEKRDSLALTRILTNHEEAMQLQSPQGLMLHGEVGTGKSMLIDLFQDCLPNRKKRRWHFNTFMLDTISRLEQLRVSGTLKGLDGAQAEHSLLIVARDLIETSPILFLDEFQFPDRVASKILSNLMTSFFQLGGVLIATSNRMPEDLAKAAGMEYEAPVARSSSFGWSLGLSREGRRVRDDGPGQKGEFATFLEVLRARCEVWEMEGKLDYRKLDKEDASSGAIFSSATPTTPNTSCSTIATGTATNTTEEIKSDESVATETVPLPRNYLIEPATAEELTTFAEQFNALVEDATATPYPIPWSPATLTVYGRRIDIPAQHNGVAFFEFSELCGAVLGPADYITLASTYHTFILTNVPIMQFLQKNEARRLITLLDALYEARCRLLITAAAGPDSILFPEIPSSPTTSDEEQLLNDAVHPETYSEIYQDATSPFRPNISSYNSDTLAHDALEDDPPNRFRQPGSSYTDERRLSDGSKAPDFANIGGLTGEDERFAVKRAESRIWEMCSKRWWDRSASTDASESPTIERDISWWRPLPLESRHWERPSSSSSISTPSTLESDSHVELPPNVKILSEDEQQGKMFPHGASPFRTNPEAPPRIDWTHVWGTVKWGKKAGAWGKGVEGLEERKTEKTGGEEGGKVEEK